MYFRVKAKTGLKLRKRASTFSAMIAALPNNTRVQRIDDKIHNGFWFHIGVELANQGQVKGFSHSKYLEKEEPDETSELVSPEEAQVRPRSAPDLDQIYFVNASSLRLREEANSNSAILMNMPYGTVVTKIEDASALGWWKVTTRAGSMMEEGFAHSKFLLPMKPKPIVKVDLSVLRDLGQSIQRIREFVGDYADDLDENLLLELNKVVERYGISENPRRFSHFMAQLAHESANFRTLEENLNYSAKRLREVFTRYFMSDEQAHEYAGNPEMIANRVYGNRMGNGNEASGDGYSYRGRGFIQLTGRNNYRNIGDRISMNIEKDPDLVSSDPKVALLVAADYWDSRNINAAADMDDVVRVTELVNGGHHGMDKRIRRLAHAKSIWGG